MEFITYAIDCQMHFCVVLCCLGSGALMELFDSSSGIKPMSECRFQEPKIVCKNGGYEYLDDYVFGFGRICASDERIYAAYDGQSTAAGYRMPPEGSRPLLFGNIAVFDWLGRPIAIYRSDYRIDCICIDAAESDVLFATLSDAEGRKYTGRISL